MLGKGQRILNPQFHCTTFDATLTRFRCRRCYLYRCYYCLYGTHSTDRRTHSVPSTCTSTIVVGRMLSNTAFDNSQIAFAKETEKEYAFCRRIFY